MPVSIEQHVDWITDCLRHLRRTGSTGSSRHAEAEDDWVEHHNEVTATTLLPRANSWWVGANIPGKPRRTSTPTSAASGSTGGLCDEVAAKGYEGFETSTSGASAMA